MMLRIFSITALIALVISVTSSPPRAQFFQREPVIEQNKAALKQKKAAKKERCKSLKTALKGVGTCQ